jgi:hypothetical protein
MQGWHPQIVAHARLIEARRIALLRFHAHVAELYREPIAAEQSIAVTRCRYCFASIGADRRDGHCSDQCAGGTWNICPRW